MLASPVGLRPPCAASAATIGYHATPAHHRQGGPCSAPIGGPDCAPIDNRAAYNRYVAPFAGIDDLKIAPFHLLASEGAVHCDKDHLWHMSAAHRLAAADPSLLLATEFKRIDLGDPAQVGDAIAWWEAMTAAGGEGMVVKPIDYIARGQKGLLQPAIKCRGREYLRIIYGPHYDRSENLERLKKRGLGHKRSMALREFALGLESLHRFVEHAPLTRVHQCVFGVLAMESELVDPRL